VKDKKDGRSKNSRKKYYVWLSGSRLWKTGSTFTAGGTGKTPRPKQEEKKQPKKIQTKNK